uniref:G domain-containing protein n=1 Tax=Globodera rostochiensis TaxID=31243 RepID=A0A914IB44_GLORO
MTSSSPKNAGGIEVGGKNENCRTSEQMKWAAVQVQSKDKSITYASFLRYEFFTTEAEPLSVSVSGAEQCNPTVGDMTLAILPKHSRLSLEQLAAQFDLQVQQYLDTDSEPDKLIDIDGQQCWYKPVEHLGEYNLLLHPKLDDRRQDGGDVDRAAKLGFFPLSEFISDKKQHMPKSLHKVREFVLSERIQSCLQSVEQFELLLPAAGQSQNKYAYTLTKDQLNKAKQMLENLESEKAAIYAAIRNFVIFLDRGESVEPQLRPGTSFDEAGTEEFGQAIQNAVDQFQTNGASLLKLHDEKLLPKIELIRRLESEGVHYIGHGERRMADVFRGNEDSDLASALHFVLLYSQAQTTPPDVAGSLHKQCLGQLFEMAGRGKMCTYIDLEVLLSYDNSALEHGGLPEGIRALDGFPNIDSRLVKMRGPKLLTADCVMEECDKLKKCIARIDDSQLTKVGAVPPADQKKHSCSLPCPLCKSNGGKCQNDDFYWGCDDCGKMLAFVNRENVPVTHFYCDCGATPVEAFTFRCLDVQTHGDKFVHFAPNELAIELREMEAKGILNILLLGGNGVGKSTLINALVNYLKHPTFKDAIKADKIEHVIPAKFNTEEYDADGCLVKREVYLGEQSEDEQLKTGNSRTKWPNAYIIHSKEYKIRLIDTPGIGGTDGEVKEDNENFHKTLNFISTLPELHAVCILLQSNTRTEPALKYCINGLLTYLHKNAAPNIVFMSTFGRGAFYKMGETRELLQEILNPIEAAHNLSIPLHRNRIYCVDNEAFKHLCLIKKANVQYSEKEMDNISESWSRADQEFQRLFKYIPKLKPHRTLETMSFAKDNNSTAPPKVSGHAIDTVRYYAGKVPGIGRFVKSQAQPSSSSSTSNRAKKNNQ